MRCAKFLVRGRVQGVFFRASTRAQALALGLRGYAKNLADGSVEVLACGAEDALDRLQSWLRQGPPAARIDEVHRIDFDASEADGSGEFPAASLTPGFLIRGE
ncbi:acylphosphatase [Rudaea sp.]|uniref:acylphosphatase n=1 Tax=Rudaea sp. TaxID=2136325 RepID=UPI002ED4CDD7